MCSTALYRNCVRSARLCRTSERAAISAMRWPTSGFQRSHFIFMQSPSFLAHQRALSRARERSNGETLFAMSRIPTDNQIRAMLDPVTPDRLYPLFASLLERLETGGGLRPFRRLDGHPLVALDGTECFCSRKIFCSNGSRRKRGDGAVEYHHNMVTAALVAPGHARAIPLVPEVVVPQDGQEKQDCESRAARRWLAAHGPGLARLKPICIGDDLYSRQPICETVQAVGGHFLFVAKPGSHPTLHDGLDGVELPVHEERVKKGRGFQTHRYRWLTNLPIRDGKDPLTVNWLDIEIINTAGNVTYRNSFVTDLAVDSEQRRRACRVRTCPLEDRERDLQRAQEQRLPSRAQLRPRQGEPVSLARHLEPLCLRLPRVVRKPRNRLGKGPRRPWVAPALLRAPAHHNQLPRLSLLVRPRANPQNRTTTTRQGQPLKQSRDPESRQPSLEKSEQGPNVVLCGGPATRRPSGSHLTWLPALGAVRQLCRMTWQAYRRSYVGGLDKTRLFDGEGRRGHLSREQEAELSVPISAWDGANNSYLATAGHDNTAVTANTDDPPDVLFGVQATVLPLI